MVERDIARAIATARWNGALLIGCCLVLQRDDLRGVRWEQRGQGRRLAATRPTPMHFRKAPKKEEDFRNRRSVTVAGKEASHHSHHDELGCRARWLCHSLNDSSSINQEIEEE